MSETYDVIIAGSGAGGLATAITAASEGLSVLVVEKAPHFGGTTARSGGWIWIPGNRQAAEAGFEDSAEKARGYIELEAGNHFDAARVDAFLNNAPRMLDWFQENTSATFTLGPLVCDYHAELPGGMAGGRSLNADAFDRAELGEHGDRVAPPIPELTFMGMMIGSNRELRHFFEAFRSVGSFGYVVKLFSKFVLERLRYGKSMRLTNGNAMAGRLAKSCFDLGVEIRTDTPLVDLVTEEGSVTGVVVESKQGRQTLTARRGVVLATGGFPFDMEMRKKLYRHAPTGEGHYSPANPHNTGDAMRLSKALGADTREDYPHPASWIPVSPVKRKDGTMGVFPHFVDRGKPGVIAVMRNGKRFVDEAHSYHDYGEALIAAHQGDGEAESWLIVDHATLRRYGLGKVKPYPFPLRPEIASGYLIRGRTIAELAQNAGIDPAGLEATVGNFNKHARETGDDPEFGRGSTPYDRYMGDPDHKPNPCVKPIETGPFYAIRVVLGDLGSFAGLRADADSRVLGQDGHPIPGLYAVGNDAASLFGGAYSGAGITLGPAMTFGFLVGRHLAGKSDTQPGAST